MAEFRPANLTGIGVYRLLLQRSGVKSPVIDALIAKIVAAQGDKEKLLPLGRALDRVLTSNYYMLPMWYMGEDRVARWDKFSCPPFARFIRLVLIRGGMT